MKFAPVGGVMLKFAPGGAMLKFAPDGAMLKYVPDIDIAAMQKSISRQ